MLDMPDMGTDCLSGSLSPDRHHCLVVQKIPGSLDCIPVRFGWSVVKLSSAICATSGVTSGAMGVEQSVEKSGNGDSGVGIHRRLRASDFCERQCGCNARILRGRSEKDNHLRLLYYGPTNTCYIDDRAY